MNNGNVAAVKEFKKSLNELVGIALEYPDFMDKVALNNFKLEFMGMKVELGFYADTVDAVNNLLERYIEDMEG